jgi:DNA adenine methylase
VKWAGGKTQLLDQLDSLYPPAPSVNRYIEPFVGSGAVFFHVRELLQPGEAILADGNEELINAYSAIRDDVEKVIRHLVLHRKAHSKAHYYDVRGASRARLSEAGRAARLIYLNKTCFNGLYRVNSRGEFNVPMGRYDDPPILDAANLRAVSAALRRVNLKVAHFRETLGYARKGDFIYLDPPYHPLSATSSFTSYSVNGGRSSFEASDQEELAGVFAALARRGCRVMLSNSDCPLIRRLYRGYDIRTVLARRSINSKAERRGRIHEVVVLDYEPASDSNPLVQLISDERGERKSVMFDGD